MPTSGAAPRTSPTAPLFSTDAPIYGGGVAPKVAAPGATDDAAAPKPTGDVVPVVGPDGRTYGLDRAFLAEAAAKGYRAETPDETGIRRYLDENKGASGTVKVALGALANEAAFGVLDPLRAATEDPYERAKRKALEEEHGVAGLLGGAAGFGVSLLYGGPLAKGAALAGRAAERAVVGGVERAVARTAVEQLATRAVEGRLLAHAASAAARAEVKAAAPGVAKAILGAAARTGTEAATFAAPRVATEAALGDPERAAETLMWALGGGAVFGAAGKLVGEAAGAARARIGEKLLPGAGGEAGGKAGFLRTLADEQAWRSLAPNQASLKKGAREAARIEGGQTGVGRFLHDEGLVRAPGESYEAWAQKLAGEYEASEKKIGDIYHQLDMAPGAGPRGLKVGPLTERLEREVVKPLDALVGYEPIVTDLRGKVEELTALAAQPQRRLYGLGGRVTFEEAHKIRKGLADLVTNWDGPPTATARGKLRQFVGVLRSEIEDQAAAQGSTELLVELKAANLRYRKLKAANTVVADYLEQRALTNRAISLTDYLSGGAGGVISAVTGSPIPAIMGVGTALAHNVVRHEGNALLAKVADALAGGPGARSGLVAVERALGGAGRVLDDLPKALTGALTKETIETLPANVLARIARKKSEGDARKDYAHLAERLTDLTASPERLAATLEEITAPIAVDAPGIAAAYAAKASAALQHLQQTMPKTPEPLPSFGKGTAWSPSDAQIAEWSKRAAVVDDPLSVLRQRSIGRPEMDTLRAVYPKLHADIVRRIRLLGADPKGPKLDYQQRMRVASLLGQPLDRGMARVAAYQQAFASSPGAAEPAPGASQGGGPALRLPSAATDIQRITG